MNSIIFAAVVTLVSSAPADKACFKEKVAGAVQVCEDMAVGATKHQFNAILKDAATYLLSVKKDSTESAAFEIVTPEKKIAVIGASVESN